MRFTQDYILVTKKIEIKESMLSNYCMEIANKHNISVGGFKKLAPILDNKGNYFLHCRDLLLYSQE